MNMKLLRVIDVTLTNEKMIISWEHPNYGFGEYIVYKEEEEEEITANSEYMDNNGDKRFTKELFKQIAESINIQR